MGRVERSLSVRTPPSPEYVKRRFIQVSLEANSKVKDRIMHCGQKIIYPRLTRDQMQFGLALETTVEGDYILYLHRRSLPVEPDTYVSERDLSWLYKSREGTLTLLEAEMSFHDVGSKRRGLGALRALDYSSGLLADSLRIINGYRRALNSSRH